MKLQIIQEEFEGVPQTPETFTDEAKAFDHFHAKVQSQGFRAKYDDEDQLRYVQRYNTWYNSEGECLIHWWEIDMPVLNDLHRFISTFSEAITDKKPEGVWEGMMLIEAKRILELLK